MSIVVKRMNIKTRIERKIHFLKGNKNSSTTLKEPNGTGTSVMIQYHIKIVEIAYFSLSILHYVT